MNSQIEVRRSGGALVYANASDPSAGARSAHKGLLHSTHEMRYRHGRAFRTQCRHESATTSFIFAGECIIMIIEDEREVGVYFIIKTVLFNDYGSILN